MDIKNAIEYVESLEIPAVLESDSTLELELESTSSTTEDLGSKPVITIGSQIVEFADTVKPELRSHVSNTFLLARLAADQEVSKTGSDTNWYPKYLEVLTAVGWVPESADGISQKFKDTGLSVHQQILPVLTALMGGSVAGTALIFTVLEKLGEMDSDSPWITLFDKNSKKATVNQFQMSYVSSENGQSPSMKLAQFELTASTDVAQVLFFRLQESSISLESNSLVLSSNEAVFNQLKQTVENKVNQFTSQYIAGIDLPPVSAE